MVWHANQVAKYNIKQGIMPPMSGHWLNNPHADDIDYQIEADFAGLMSPGMPNTASEISDKVGHIFTYGDGWYGGVYVGALYSMAFVSDDMQVVVEEALKTIPEQSDFYNCVRDVIDWHRQYPDDWKQTWCECQKKWRRSTPGASRCRRDSTSICRHPSPCAERTGEPYTSNFSPPYENVQTTRPPSQNRMLQSSYLPKLISITSAKGVVSRTSHTISRSLRAVSIPIGIVPTSRGPYGASISIMRVCTSSS